MLLKYTMENEVLSTACVTLGRDHLVLAPQHHLALLRCTTAQSNVQFYCSC